MISIRESYVLFIETLSYLDEKNLEKSDEDLEYYIFEELSADAVCFLHELTIDKLVIAKLIPINLKDEILILRNEVLEQLEKTSSIKEYRKDLNWCEIRNGVEEIKKKIMFNTFGNKVRIKRTIETEEKGLAEKEGEIYGHSTPSIMDFEVIGTLKEDVAINVHFDDLNESFWFTEDLIENIDNGQGAEITINGINKKWTKGVKGEWIEENTEKESKWWQFWK